MMGTNRPSCPGGQQQRNPYQSQTGPRPQNQQNGQNQRFQGQTNPRQMGTGFPSPVIGGHNNSNSSGGQYFTASGYHQQYYPPPPPPPRPPMPPKSVMFVPATAPVPLIPPGISDHPSEKGSGNTNIVPPTPPPSSLIQPGGTQINGASAYSPLAPPPLPPLFPYLSPELAKSLEQGATKCGTSFNRDSCELPFIPVIINDDDLKKMTEQVKTQIEENKGKNMLLYEDIIDQQLPKELKEMFQPLYCKLCKLTLSSPVVARDHYKGKKHKRAAEVWMQNNPEKSKNRQGANVVSHQGANPHGILNGIITPIGQSNVSRQLPPAPPPPVMDNIRRGPPVRDQRGFNRPPLPNQASNNRQNFERKRTFSSAEMASSNKPEFIPAYRAALAGPAKKKPKTGNNGPNFGYCELCKVSLTSQVNADQHYSGRNHTQKLLANRRNGEFGEDPKFGIGSSFANGPRN